MGLKRLRIKDWVINEPDERVVKLLGKFPSLECLFIENSSLTFGCSLMSDWLQNSVNLLQGVKHLVVYNYSNWPCMEFAGWYSLLTFLTGLESLIVHCNSTEIITGLPVKELPRLKLIQFPWDDQLDTTKLLEVTGGVKKVLISNCCFVLSRKLFWSKSSLRTFFESAPNAECGCGSTLWSQWFPEDKFISASESD